MGYWTEGFITDVGKEELPLFEEFHRKAKLHYKNYSARNRFFHWGVKNRIYSVVSPEMAKVLRAYRRIKLDHNWIEGEMFVRTEEMTNWTVFSHKISYSLCCHQSAIDAEIRVDDYREAMVVAEKERNHWHSKYDALMSDFEMKLLTRVQKALQDLEATAKS